MTQTTSPLRALLNVEASASVPKLSDAQMLDAPENSARPGEIATRKMRDVVQSVLDNVDIPSA
jgi:hypothetical protein